MRLQDIVRERGLTRALSQVTRRLGLVKAKFGAMLDKTLNQIFFGEAFESFMNALVLLAGFYFLAHIVMVLAKRWQWW